MFACQDTDLQAVDALLASADLEQQDEVSFRQKGDTALAYAVKAGHPQLVQKLIAAGASVHTVNNVRQRQAGHSLAFVAAWTSQLDILRNLISHGIDVNLPDKRKWTPLMVACANNNIYIVKLLLEHGADPHLRDCVLST